MINVYTRSNFGFAFHHFWKNHLSAIDNKTTVLILGDARNNYNDPKAWCLRDIQNKAKNVVWLNPESPSAWGFGDSVMNRYLPYCDVVEECQEPPPAVEDRRPDRSLRTLVEVAARTRLDLWGRVRRGFRFMARLAASAWRCTPARGCGGTWAAGLSLHGDVGCWAAGCQDPTGSRDVCGGAFALASLPGVQCSAARTAEGRRASVGPARDFRESPAAHALVMARWASGHLRVGRSGEVSGTSLGAVRNFGESPGAHDLAMARWASGDVRALEPGCRAGNPRAGGEARAGREGPARKSRAAPADVRISIHARAPGGIEPLR